MSHRHYSAYYRLLGFAILLLFVLWVAFFGVTRPIATIAQHTPPDIVALENASAVIVYGWVQVANGEVQTGWLVQAIRDDSSVAEVASVSPDGWFSFPALPPVPYQLQLVDQQGMRLPLTGESSRQVWPDANNQEYLLVVKDQTHRPVDLLIAAPEVPTQILPTSALLASATPITPSVNTITTSNFAPDQTGKITGRVIAEETNQPLTENELVIYAYASPTATQEFQTATPDASGYYTVGNLLPGNYYIKSRPYNTDLYVTEFYNNQPNQANANPVAVVDNQTTTGIDAALRQAGVIAGRVTDAITGDGVDQAEIDIFLEADKSYIKGTTSNSTGYYTVTGLPAGSYVLLVPSHYEENYVGQYYNNKQSWENADRISVAENSVQQIDIVLQRGSIITGRVTASASGAPLSGVGVSAYVIGGASFNSASTDAAGNYTITRLTPNIYIVKFEAAGDYASEYYNNHYIENAANLIDVAANSTTANIDAALEVGGKITGRVTADTGTPLPNGLVTLYQRDLCNSLRVVRSVNTTASGVYIYTGLLAGAYWVRFDEYDQEAGTYLGQYYNNKTTGTSADSVNVTLGNTTENINGVLQPGARISGQITAQGTNQPLGGVSVNIYRQEGNQFFYVRAVTSDGSGLYQSPPLPAGRYQLYFSPSSLGRSSPYAQEFYKDKGLGVPPDLIDLATGEQRGNIDAQLNIGGQITGIVSSLVTGQPLAGVDAYVYLRTANSLIYVGSTSTNQSGIYTTVSVATGSYLVWFDTRSNNDEIDSYISLFYNNKPDSTTADGVNVTAGQITPNINIQLNKGGEIRGRVTEKTSGAPLRSIYAYARLLDANSFTSVTSDPTDENGEYVLRGLRTDAYKVEFLSFCREGTTYERQFYNQQATFEAANPVNVSAPNVVSNINGLLTLRPGSVAPPTPTPIPPEFLKQKVYLPVVQR